MTVSRALTPLVTDGLIERRRRAGTFVAAPRHERTALTVPDMRAEVESEGRSYSFVLLGRTLAAMTDADRQLVPRARGPLLRLTGLHRADLLPYSLEYRLIDLQTTPAAEAADFSSQPPGSWLLEHAPWSDAAHRISAVNASAEIATGLKLDIGAACLSLERWTSRSGNPITYVRQYYSGKTFALLTGFTP